MLRQKEKPHWVSFSFGSIISRHLFHGTWQPKCKLFEISQKASRASQKGLAGHMLPACLRPLVYALYHINTCDVDMGIRREGKTGICTPLEFRTKKQKFIKT